MKNNKRSNGFVSVISNSDYFKATYSVSYQYNITTTSPTTNSVDPPSLSSGKAQWERRGLSWPTMRKQFLPWSTAALTAQNMNMSYGEQIFQQELQRPRKWEPTFVLLVLITVYQPLSTLNIISKSENI